MMCKRTWLKLLNWRRTGVFGKPDPCHEHLDTRSSSAIAGGPFEVRTSAELFRNQEGAVKEGRRLWRDPAVLFEPFPISLQILCGLLGRHSMMIRRRGSPRSHSYARGYGALYREWAGIKGYLGHAGGEFCWVHGEGTVEGRLSGGFKTPEWSASYERDDSWGP